MKSWPHDPGSWRALTLHEPWATLIACGVKTLETRSWPSSHNGALLVHAGANRDHVVPGAVVGDWMVRRTDGEFVVANRRTGATVPLGCSAVRGVATITGSLPMVDAPAAPGDCLELDGATATVAVGGVGVDVSDQLPFGFFEPGRFAWMLADAVCFDDPPPARGFQRLWRPSPALVGEALARLG